MYTLRRFLAAFLFLGFFSMIFTQNIFAEGGAAGVAFSVPVAGDPTDGSVICGEEGKNYKACSREYDPNMVGIVVENPAISFEPSTEISGAKSLVSTGKTYVRVSSINGAIKVGDYITSSKIEGVAQKGTKSGYVLGSALEEHTDTNPENTGRILVSLAIKPAVFNQNAGMNLVQMIKDGVDGAFESPLSALRYFVAAIITTITFIYGFVHFGRIAKSGVEAVGRNPLAAKSIQMGVLMNMGITVAIMAGSIFVSYLILVI